MGSWWCAFRPQQGWVRSPAADRLMHASASATELERGGGGAVCAHAVSLARARRRAHSTSAVYACAGDTGAAAVLPACTTHVVTARRITHAATRRCGAGVSTVVQPQCCTCQHQPPATANRPGAVLAQAAAAAAPRTQHSCGDLTSTQRRCALPKPNLQERRASVHQRSTTRCHHHGTRQ